jgi:patatin-like phospholipase/acyl hydrolase
MSEIKPHTHLAFPGGGAFGYLQSWIISQVKKENLAKVNSVSGTSIGSTNACAIALGIEDKIYELFPEAATHIFAGYWYRHFGLLNPRYPDKALCDFLKKLFGDTKFKECKIPTWVISDNAEDRSPKVYKSFDKIDGEMPIWQVCRASCAAPTYFKRYNNMRDGGLVANNPSMCAFVDIVDMENRRQNIDSIYVSIIDTGDFPYTPQPASKWILVEALTTLSRLLNGASNQITTYQMRKLLAKDHLLYLDPIVKSNMDMDDPELPVKLKEYCTDNVKILSEQLDTWLKNIPM